jgi:hypothetical protein
VQLYTATKIDLRDGAVPEKEVMALVEWADKTRASGGLLQNALRGNAYVRMKGGAPQFELTSRGLAEGTLLADQMGLPSAASFCHGFYFVDKLLFVFEQ